MQKPELVLLCSVLPLIVVITTSIWAGIFVEGILVGLVWLVNHAVFGGPFPGDLAALTISMGAFSGLVGWTASRELLNLADWSISSYENARRNLNEARDRQLEFAQIQEDLSLANSELARLSNRMKALEQIAEDARHATTEFVANVSHELRTPLNMIIGYADMISRSPKVYGAKLPSPLTADITAILKNAHHLSNLVNDVLDLSQVEAGRMVISRDWAPMEQTINMALSTVAGLFESQIAVLEV